MFESGLTVLAELTHAEAPFFQGLAIAVHPNAGFYESTEGLWFALLANSPNDGGDPNRVVMRHRSSQPFPGSESPFVQSEMLDGFEVVFGANADGWSYRVDGLASQPLKASGAYPDGVTCAGLVDGNGAHQSFVSVALQTKLNNADPVFANVERIRVFAGTCAPGDRPSPAP